MSAAHLVELGVCPRLVPETERLRLRMFAHLSFESVEQVRTEGGVVSLRATLRGLNRRTVRSGSQVHSSERAVGSVQ